MANTIVGRSTYSGYDSNSNDKMITHKWQKDLFKHSLARNSFKRFMGTGSDNIFQVQKDFLKEKGDKLTFTLRGLLTGDGQGDDGTYEGNEEALSFFTMDAQIHERGNSVKVNGKMTEQRTIVNLRSESKSALGEWYGNVQALDMVCALSGLPTLKLSTGVRNTDRAVDADGNYIETVEQVSVEKGDTATRWFGGGQKVSGTLARVATDALITSATDHLFGTLVISKVKRMAQAKFHETTGAPLCPIRPVMVDGEPHYVMFINPRQAKDLKAETAWINAQKSANIRGRKNPLFTGALGMWDNVIIHETSWILTRKGAGGTDPAEYFDATSDACYDGITVARGLFCGAQAAVVPYGQLPSWIEKLHDYKTKFGVHTDVIYGVKKTKFNSATTGGSDMTEFGCIVVDTAVSSD